MKTVMNIRFTRLVLVLCIALITGCFQTDTQQHQLKLKEARSGLAPAVNQVSQIKDFDVITVRYFELYDDEHGPPVCYYARAYLLIGTSASSPEALTVFAAHLQALGWGFTELRQHEDAKTFVRGRNERAAISANGPGPELEGAADYNQLRGTYRSLLFLNIDYVLPAANGC